MLEAIKRYLGRGSARSTVPEDPAASALAAATILLVTARCDSCLCQEEEQAIHDILISKWGIAEEDVEEMMRAAEREARLDQDPWEFSHAVNQHLGHADKLALSQRMWEVVYADGRLHQLEREMVNRLGRFLGLTQEEMADARAAAASRQSG